MRPARGWKGHNGRMGCRPIVPRPTVAPPTVEWVVQIRRPIVPPFNGSATNGRMGCRPIVPPAAMRISILVYNQEKPPSHAGRGDPRAAGGHHPVCKRSDCAVEPNGEHRHPKRWIDPNRLGTDGALYAHGINRLSPLQFPQVVRSGRSGTLAGSSSPQNKATRVRH